MRTLFTPLCLAAALAFPLDAAVAAPAGDDQIAASFERMLNHVPVATAPAAPTGRADDPLHTHLVAVLWERHPSPCGPARATIAAAAPLIAH